MSFLKKLGLVSAGSGLPRGKKGCRAYAVGDIHGRLDLLDILLAKIEDDMAAQPAGRTFIIFLGDLIDRGPDSAGVIERLRTYRNPSAELVFLSGNHEEVLLDILSGKLGVLPAWLKFGGAECAQSYGIDPEQLRQTDERRAIELVRNKVPRAHREFLRSFADTFRFGEYLFVHAGIRPGVGLDDQERKDLRWIREPFLGDAKEHGFVVVHGHTIVRDVEERPNRIGIDTGAYQSGILTAIAIEEERRWFMRAEAGEAGASAASFAA
ncbi:MAG TPA: metallophosphoesterase family protein [Allosphingosinicella sp.]|jgi:serine/threonine protein phosphatase 1|uniref:metallophosphoesterase family protein n=1 Tax=Allosphingosinicella sp. TaxID=2823234 RepID=UPI002F2AA0DA